MDQVKSTPIGEMRLAAPGVIMHRLTEGVSVSETDPRVSAPLLLAEVRRLFPDLRETKVTHSWMGFVAYSFDSMPHLGKHEGLWYASGYCGSGVSLASYFGMRLGQQVIGLEEGRTGLDGLTYESRPYYFGNPWFLAPSIRYYRWKDRQGVPAA